MPRRLAGGGRRPPTVRSQHTCPRRGELDGGRRPPSCKFCYLECGNSYRNNPRVTVQFPIAFFSLFGDFSGKGEVFQKWFSQWTTTSKRFHPKIPTRSKVMAVLKWGTSGAIYFLSTWFQRVFMSLLLLSPEKGVGNKKI